MTEYEKEMLAVGADIAASLRILTETSAAHVEDPTEKVKEDNDMHILTTAVMKANMIKQAIAMKEDPDTAEIINVVEKKLYNSELLKFAKKGKKGRLIK